MYRRRLFLFFLIEDNGADIAGGTPSPEPVPTPAPDNPPADNPEGEVIDLADKLKNRVQAKYESQLKKDYQNDDFKDVEDINKLYEAYKTGKTKLAHAVVIPGKDATIEEVKDFFFKIGMPKKAEDYQLSDYDINPDEIAGFKKHFTEAAFKAGLTKSQASTVWSNQAASYSALMQSMIKMTEDAKSQYPAKMDALMKEAYPDDTRRAKRITEEANLYKAYCAKNGLGEYFEKTGLSYNPEFVRKVALMYEKIDPVAAFVSEGGSGGNTETEKLKRQYPTMF